jgi:hypothetical protein
MNEWLQAMWLVIGFCVLAVFGWRRRWEGGDWFVPVVWVLFAWMGTFLPDQTPFQRFGSLCMTSVIAYLGGYVFGIKIGIESTRNE